MGQLVYLMTLVKLQVFLQNMVKASPLEHAVLSSLNAVLRLQIRILIFICLLIVGLFLFFFFFKFLPGVHKKEDKFIAVIDEIVICGTHLSESSHICTPLQ